MRMTIYIGGIAAMFACLALILAVPDMQAVINGTDKTRSPPSSTTPSARRFESGDGRGHDFLHLLRHQPASGGEPSAVFLRPRRDGDQPLLRRFLLTQVPVAALFVSGVLPA
jgi:hypothetical protein